MRATMSRLGMAAIAVTLGALVSGFAPAHAFTASAGKSFSENDVSRFDGDVAELITPVQFPGFFEDDDDGNYQPRRRGYYDQRQRGYYYDDAPRGYNQQRGYYQQPGYYSNKEALKQQLRDQKEQQKRAIKRGYYNNPGASGGSPQRGVRGGNSFD